MTGVVPASEVTELSVKERVEAVVGAALIFEQMPTPIVSTTYKRKGTFISVYKKKSIPP